MEKNAGWQNVNIPFSALINELIIKKGIERKMLAQKIGYDPKIIARMCNGHIPPKKTIIAFGVALGYDIFRLYLLLYWAEYSFNEFKEEDRKYIKAIEKFGGCTAAIDNIDDELRRLGADDSLLLFNHRKLN